MRLSQLKFFDKNSFIHIALIAVVLFLSFFISFWFLLLYPAFLLVADVLYYRFSVVIFDPELVVQKGYQVSGFFNDTLHSEGLDYGFNFYNGNYKKKRHQAQIDKFEYAIKQLQLAPGMSVIDIGCGCGDWLQYLKEKGLHVVGVNITYEQVQECKKRGLDVIWSNWKDIENNVELQQRFYGKFDAVTFWDTVEHYVPMCFRKSKAKQNEIYQNMFQLANNLLKQQHSHSQRIFISCLHMRHNVSDLPWNLRKIKTLFYCYLLDKFHSGCYPGYEDDQLVANSKEYFKIVHRLDTTLDYYMTSKLESTHFGRHRFKWSFERVLVALSLILLDPHWVHRILWYYAENWMMQFNEADITRSDVIHWWLTFERTPLKEKKCV